MFSEGNWELRIHFPLKVAILSSLKHVLRLSEEVEKMEAVAARSASPGTFHGSDKSILNEFRAYMAVWNAGLWLLVWFICSIFAR